VAAVTRHYATAPRAHELGPLIASMDRHCSPYTLHVLCWDFWPARRQPPHITCVSREAFLQAHPDYAPENLPGPPRRTVDAVVTARWRWYADVFERFGEPLCCIDGDIHWFSSPEPMWAEIPAAAPFAVSPHRIPPASAGLPGVTVETHGKYGRFNCGLSVWRERAPLEEMAALNREWSYTEVVPRGSGRRPLFGDQAHVEDLAEKYGAHVIQHPGVNWAPWNAHVHRLAAPTYADHPFVDGQPLVCAHFSSLRLNPDGAVRQLADPSYEVERAPGAVELVYRPYIEAYVAALRAG
jgi:hypothetical protein